MMSEKINQAIWRNDAHYLLLFVEYRNIERFWSIDRSNNSIDICIFIDGTSMSIAKFSSIFVEKTFFISSRKVFDHWFSI